MKFILPMLLTILALSIFPACAEKDAVSPPPSDGSEDAVPAPSSDGSEDAIPAPSSNEPMLVVVTIVDTDVGQGFTPDRFTLPAGLLIELRFINADHRTGNNEASANSHPVSIRGPGVDEDIPDLEPGDGKTIIFTTQAGTVIFSCTNPACDIHDKLSGRILVTD